MCAGRIQSTNDGIVSKEHMQKWEICWTRPQICHGSIHTQNKFIRKKRPKHVRIRGYQQQLFEKKNVLFQFDTGLCHG